MVADPRRVDPRVYDAIYAVPGGAPGYDRYFQYARHIVRARDPLRYLTTRVDAAWGVYRALSKYRAVSVLEAGCGLGYLTYALKRGGYDVMGIDVSQEAVTKATRAYGDFYKTESIESYARSSEQTFDGVVMVEVIEHLENPIAAIEDALRLLSPGGCLVLHDAESSYYGLDEIWSTDVPPMNLGGLPRNRSRRSLRAWDAFASSSTLPSITRAFRYFMHSEASTLPCSTLPGASFGAKARRCRSGRAGLLHQGYWLASRAAGFFTRPSLQVVRRWLRFCGQADRNSRRGMATKRISAAAST